MQRFELTINKCITRADTGFKWGGCWYISGEKSRFWNKIRDEVAHFFKRIFPVCTRFSFSEVHKKLFWNLWGVGRSRRPPPVSALVYNTEKFRITNSQYLFLRKAQTRKPLVFSKLKFEKNSPASLRMR